LTIFACRETLKTIRILFIIIIVIIAAAVGFVVGVKQNILPFSLPEPVTLPTPLRKMLQEGTELQGYWKLEQLLLEDETGNLKEMRRSVPGAPDNYFSFEEEHVCTDGQLDLNNKPLPCSNYTTYTIDGNTISIDQPGKPPAKGTWTITGDTLEISVTEDQKKGKFILSRLPKT